MKVMLVVLLALSIFYQNLIVEAFVAMALPHPKRKPGGCYDEDYGHLKIGSFIIDCAEVTCSSDGTIDINGCASNVDETSCEDDIEMDPKKPYPQCCPVICRSPIARYKKASRTTTKRPPQKTSKPAVGP